MGMVISEVPFSLIKGNVRNMKSCLPPFPFVGACAYYIWNLIPNSSSICL